MNDGIGDRTGACREYTLPRDDPNSVIKLWIKGQRGMSPVLQVKTSCHLDIHEICKEYTSYYRKLATETVQIQQEELHEH